MNRKEAAIAITNEFISEFNSTTPVSFENIGTFWYCTSPSLTPTTKQSDKPWVRFCVEDNKTPRSTLGTKGHRRFRRTGFVSAQVFVPEGTATSAGRDLCEEIINIFEGERIATDIVFDYGDYKSTGNLESGWYLLDVTIYYSFDEKK